MPLSPTITPQEVADIGALTPALFQVADTTAMNLLIQSALDYADGWFAGHSGLNYGLTTPAWVPVLQRRGVIYLALEALSDTLKARKIYGVHAPYMSEESPAYEALIDNEWGQRAREALDLWITVEKQGTGFALPLLRNHNSRRSCGGWNQRARPADRALRRIARSGARLLEPRHGNCDKVADG
jgi:hypothetical protein